MQRILFVSKNNLLKNEKKHVFQHIRAFCDTLLLSCVIFIHDGELKKKTMEKKKSKFYSYIEILKYGIFLIKICNSRKGEYYYFLYNKCLKKEVI